MSRPARALLILLATLALASLARAGQVRFNGANFTFAPASASLNLGDHAVWVITGGGHTITSGDPQTQNPDRRFSAGNFIQTLNTDSTFSWKSTGALGAETYYCIPHSPNMAGTLTLVATGASVSDFRLTQVLFNDPAGQDLAEIMNLGAAGDLAYYRLKVSGVRTQQLRIPLTTALAVPSGGHVVLHFNVSGTNSATDLYFPGFDLPATGSLALYVPNTVTPSLALADQIIDYVAWGAGGQENEATAATANLWTSGTAVSNVAAGHAIQFCGQSGQYGLARWAEISGPQFPSTSSCTTPTLRTTWGRIKSLYR